MRLLQTALWLALGISPAVAQRAPVIVILGGAATGTATTGTTEACSATGGEGPRMSGRGWR